MYGAIIGDLAGSIYEFAQTKRVFPISTNYLIEESSFYSDDTILTIAILDALLHDGDYEKYIRKYMQEYMDYKPDYKPYFKNPFSPGLIRWYQGSTTGNSKGNGAIMRISAIGYLCTNEQDVINQARLATLPTHNSDEAIQAAQIVARIIYYGNLGMTKQEIMTKMGISIAYQPFDKFNTTCNETLPNCLYVLFSSENFEEAVKKSISFGGDTDTNACIVGSMAEALYGIDSNLILSAQKKIPQEFCDVLEKGYCKVKKKTIF